LHAIPYSLKGPPYFLPPHHLPVEFKGSGPHKDRQSSSHPHQVISHNDEVLVPDLGADKVWRLRKDAEGRWTVHGHVSSESGSGPRHIVVYGKDFASTNTITTLTHPCLPKEGILYILNELSNTLSAHTLPPILEESKQLSSLPTVAKAHPGMMAGNEIHILKVSFSFIG
jgi:6-phosphogluconolactonase (cycloisomerase 2 family)